MGKYILKGKGQTIDKDSHQQMIGAGVGRGKFDGKSWWAMRGKMGKLLMERFRFELEADGLC